MDLDAVIERARTGDSGAWTELVQCSQDMTFGYAVALLGDFHLAQDVVQEAFISAYGSLHRLRTAAAWHSWLRTIVRFQCGRAWRKRQFVNVPLDQASTVLSAAPSPADQVIARETRGAVLAAINDLPADARAAVILRYIYDHSQAEIAAFLNVPVATVNNRLHAARKRLKRSMIAMARDEFTQHGLPDDFASRIGTIVATHGPLIDVQFAPDDLPPVLSLLALTDDGTAVAEVAQVVSSDTVRGVVLAPHGAELYGRSITATRAPATQPVSDAVARAVVEQLGRDVAQQPQVIETGIKVIDLLCPLVRGGSVGVFGDRRVGKLTLMQELIYRLQAADACLTAIAFTHADDVAEVWYGNTPAATGRFAPVYMAAADPADRTFAASFATLDSAIYLARDLADHNVWPAIDVVASMSRP